LLQTITDTIIGNNRNDKIGESNNNKYPINYMFQIFKHHFPNIKFNYTSTNEIEKKIIKSIKKYFQGCDEISVKV
jgi:hypothetical protein